MPDHSDLYYFDYSDDESDDDSDNDNWSQQGAMPIESLLSAMDYLTPEAAVLSVTPLPYGSYTPLPVTSNSNPYTGAELYTTPYVSPQVQRSPYQPSSRPHTPLAYGTTPLMQPRWSSPGAMYPSTAYTSPAPARYSNPYPPASPAAGYATSPYAAASLVAGYTNLAQSCSSSYVPPLQGSGSYN
ncbi:hypothetical protein K438DRAFT_455291 [Mycena galopus ATCC 62051]|nr:hypothetical protein K438DRAFT_455291 [Mycena galopus ATCC 62051]